MILDPEDASLFYRAWWPLLTWVNDQRGVVPRFATATPGRPLSPALALPVRNALWADDSLREQFLAEGASELGAAERELIASWKHRVSDRFVVFKHLKKHSIFMSKEVFAVVGLYSRTSRCSSRRCCYRFETRSSSTDSSSRCRSGSVQEPVGCFTLSSPRRKRTPGCVRHCGRILIWDSDALDLVQPAFIRFAEDRFGELGMIVISAGLDSRYGERDGKPFVEFSFIGDDDGHPCSGRGWASLEPDGTLHGRLFFHQGDDSGFVAQRSDEGAMPRPAIRKRPAGRRRRM